MGLFLASKGVLRGFWLGRIYEDCFWLELDFPVSVHDGLGFLIEVTRVELRSDECDANYSPFDEMPGLRLGWVILSLQCMAYATKVFANR
ncbi:hypothetical protein IU321_005014 [Escherichia coli]|nr:hypothetical protein [Escherichia coli]EGO6601511.1 hypothetical protein [Escherichia coli]EGO6629823.1 hypothetical protein [Escherichia coli]